MAKQFGGAFANYYGKVGNVIARIRQGRTILSIYQPNVHNPRTEAQVAQRTDFGLITKFLSPLSQILKYGKVFKNNFASFGNVHDSVLEFITD